MTYGVCVGVITIVDHEDATYPPSVEDGLRAADNVQSSSDNSTYVVQDVAKFFHFTNIIL